LLNKANKR